MAAIAYLSVMGPTAHPLSYFILNLLRILKPPCTKEARCFSPLRAVHHCRCCLSIQVGAKRSSCRFIHLFCTHYATALQIASLWACLARFPSAGQLCSLQQPVDVKVPRIPY
jgi:hypothetical protein